MHFFAADRESSADAPGKPLAACHAKTSGTTLP
jgi:hypothetical protein